MRLFESRQISLHFSPFLLLLLICFSTACSNPNPGDESQKPIFRIEPEFPLDELRRLALKAEPPVEDGDFLKPELIELSSLDPTIQLDIRYASRNNFLGTPFYSLPRAYLQRPAAEALLKVHRKLKEKGLGLLIFDAYRPWYVTKMFWDATPQDKKDFVADPAKGSRHNRGAAVDLTIYTLKTGAPLAMPSGYDEFTERAYPDYQGGTEKQRRNRDLLRSLMESHGFQVYQFEWWHYDFKGWQNYPILNLDFDQIEPSG